MAYDTFIKIFADAHDIAFPLKIKKIPRKYLKKAPWITHGLINSSITKSKLLKIKLKYPTDSNISK
jgi:hypothetical protein